MLKTLWVTLAFLAALPFMCCFSPSPANLEDRFAVEHLDDLQSEGDRYAVLVSVNHYANQDATPFLQGSKNDMDLLAKMLVERFGFSRNQVLRLHDRTSTREGIVAALKALRQKAGPGKQLIFAFSGHGSFIEDDHPTEESNRLDETICPYDRDEEGSGDIRDDELFTYCTDILKRGGFLTVILDSCYSGNASKGDETTRLRTAPPLDTNIGKDSPLAQPELDPYKNRFTFFAASKEDQPAEETWFDAGLGKAGFYGVFSHTLIQFLWETEKGTTWENVHSSVAQEVAKHNPAQFPVLRYGHRTAPFGEALSALSPTFRISHVTGDGAMICVNAGEMAGLRKGVLLSVFDFKTKSEDQFQKPLAFYRVLATGSHHAIAELIEDKQSQHRKISTGFRVQRNPDDLTDRTWPVVLDANLPKSMRIELEQLLAKYGFLTPTTSIAQDGRRFFRIRFVEPTSENQATLHLEGFPSPMQWVLGSSPSDQTAKLMVHHMLKAVNWYALLDIRNPRTTSVNSFPFDIDVERGSCDDILGTFQPLEPIINHGELTFQDKDIIRLSYTNRSSEALFITVFFMGNKANLDVWNHSQFDALVQPGATITIEALMQIIPPFGRDWVKAFVNREKPFDPTPFLQGSKDPASVSQVPSREMFATWQTWEIPLHTVPVPDPALAGDD